MIGHKTQREFLKRIIKNHRIPQVMIFSGIDSLGKRKIGLEFIKLLNCQNKDFQEEPCGSCASCKLIERGQHPDLTLVAPEKKEIQISQIRDLQKTLSLKPQLSVFKSVIIDSAETLNSGAQNCLLKTLEEPKGNVLLILITSRIESLFETIRSRCQILKFYPVPFQELEKSFKNQISRVELQKMFLISQGRPGQIIDFLKDSQKFLQKLTIFKEIEKLLVLNLSEKFSFCQRFFKKEVSSKDLNYFLEIFEIYLRLIFLKRIGVKNENLDSLYLKTPETYSVLKIKKAIDSVENLKVLISRTNINPKLGLENLLLNV